MTNVQDRRDFEALLARLPLSDRAKSDLTAMMETADRHYHGVGHLALLWRRHRLYASAEGLTTPELDTLIACAIAYHDCVYERGRRDNEERSADVWMAASATAPLSVADRIWVADTIRATADHLAYPDLAADAPLHELARAWVLDLDLTPLGEADVDFDRNTALLRLEVPHLTEAEYDAGRLGFLRKFSNAPRVYRTPTLAAEFEAQARANFARQLIGGGPG